jgi:hypothetical protein
LVAKFKTIAMTEGTANPKAHGHEATRTPIPLSTIQQIEHISFYKMTILNLINRAHTKIVNKLIKTTALTKTFAIDLHTA